MELLLIMFLLPIVPLIGVSTGKTGGARDFNGGFIVAGSDAMNGDFTFQLGFIPAQFGVDGIFSQTGKIYFIEGQQFRIQLRNNGSYPSAAHPTVLSSNTWYHVAVVKESTTVRLYVDGWNLFPATSFPNNVPSGSNYLGADVSVSNRIFDGIIDEVIVMDRAVCANQITAMFNDDVDSHNN